MLPAYFRHTIFLQSMVSSASVIEVPDLILAKGEEYLIAPVTSGLPGAVYD